MRRAARIAIWAVALVGACSAQDLVSVAPQAAKVEYEDARVRVVRLKIAPHETLPIHDRPSRVVVPLTVNDVTATRANGTSGDVKAAAFVPAWSEPGKRVIINHDLPLENIVVELKGDLPRAQKVEQPDENAPGFIKVRFHKWLFENQYVRVYEVRIPPGEATDFYMDALESVTVAFSGGKTRDQKEGGKWGVAREMKAGAVVVDQYAKKPATHRVKNEGREEYRYVVVQLK